MQCAALGCFLPPRVFPLDAVVVMVWTSRTTGALVVTYCTCAAVRVRVRVRMCVGVFVIRVSAKLSSVL